MGYVLASFIAFIVAQVKILVTLGADVPFTLPLAMSLVGLFGALSRNIESLQVMYRVTTSRELKVGAHRNTYDRYSESLQGILHVDSDNEKREFDLRLSDGEVILPFNGKSCLLTITFTQTPSDPTQNH